MPTNVPSESASPNAILEQTHCALQSIVSEYKQRKQIPSDGEHAMSTLGGLPISSSSISISLEGCYFYLLFEPKVGIASGESDGEWRMTELASGNEPHIKNPEHEK